jgi:hypothetical protein
VPEKARQPAAGPDGRQRLVFEGADIERTVGWSRFARERMDVLKEWREIGRAGDARRTPRIPGG